MKVHMFAYREWAWDIAENLHSSNQQIDTVFVPSSHYAEGVDYLTYSSVDENDLGIKIRVKECDPKNLDTIALGIKPDDLLLFYGWSWMVPATITDNYMCFCLHPSPLPKYRGGSPIQNQIMAGETKSAVTVFQMGQGLDDGPIFYQSEMPLNGYLDKILTQMSELGYYASRDLIHAVQDIKTKPLELKIQNEAEATYCKRRKKEDGEILPTDDAKTIYNKVRGLQHPYPKAFFRAADGKMVFVEKVSYEL